MIVAIVIVAYDLSPEEVINIHAIGSLDSISSFSSFHLVHSLFHIQCDRLLLQSTSGITKCDRLLLQSASSITECDSLLL